MSLKSILLDSRKEIYFEICRIKDESHFVSHYDIIVENITK